MLVYDTLHQSLITRRLEFLSEHRATNASHPPIDRLLSRMVIALVKHAHKDSEWLEMFVYVYRLFSLMLCVVPIIYLRALVELVLPGKCLYAVVPEQAGQKRAHIPQEELLDQDNLFDHNAACNVLHQIATQLWGHGYLAQKLLDLPWCLPDDVHLVSLPPASLPREEIIAEQSQPYPRQSVLKPSIQTLSNYLSALKKEVYAVREDRARRLVLHGPR